MKKEYDFSKAKIGAISPVLKGKTKITIRLDTSVVDWFREEVDVSGGGNYQTMINNVLKSYVSEKENQKENEEVLEFISKINKRLDNVSEILKLLHKNSLIMQNLYDETVTNNEKIINDFKWNNENEVSTYSVENKDNISELVVSNAEH